MAVEQQQQQQQQQSRSTVVTVKATAKAEPTGVGEGIHLRPWYFATPPGAIKLIQVLFAIICMGCASPVLTSYTHFFMFVVASCFIVTVLLCFFYLFSLQELLTSIPWLLLELAFTAGATFLYAIAFIVQIAMTSRADYHYALKYHGYVDAYLAAGAFGLFNTLAYGAGLFFLYQDWRQQRQVTN